MFRRLILLLVSLMSHLPVVRLSSCDASCAARPVFTPSRLVVKHGDPASAICSICQSACPENLFGLERSVGEHKTKGPTIEWKVDKMTEWSPSAVCYYNVNSQKCCGVLPVTVYKAPDNVLISFDPNTLIFEGHQYTLRCAVHNVAPIANLTVTFYKGKTQLGQKMSMKTQETPVTENYTLSTTLQREDDGAQFWCEAKLELGPEGPHPPPVVKSSPITASVRSNAVALISSLSLFVVVFSVLSFCKVLWGDPGVQRSVSTKSGVQCLLEHVGSDCPRWCEHYVNCKDKPVFTPSRLVVKHGGPMSATCSVCQSGCTDSFGLEKSVGTTSKNGNTIKWTVDKMTEWEPSPFCYYNDPKIPDKQCCTKLPITVYKLPDSVSISIFNHTGSMYEGHQYTLQCEVQNVAPIENLSVTFYRGNTPLGQPQSVNNPAKKPASDTYSQSITASKEDDGAQHWCEAKLELGPEGPHPPPVMKSQNITTTVYYKPYLQGTSHPDPITIEEQHPLKLNCSAVANPPPTYTWTLPVTDANRSSISGSVLTISSVTSADKGNYSCTVNNTMGNQTVTFSVDVQHKPYLQGTSHPDPITIEEQHPLKLNCSAVANPPPTYTWTLPVTDANRSSISGSVLTISSVTSADKGNYSCTVNNTMGNQTVTFSVDVQHKPYLQGTSHPDPITIEEQHPLKLNCSAVANPPPTYTWTLPVTDANRSSISGSVLTISSVTSADKGNYSCTVNNTMGNQTVTFSVDVQHKPYLQGTSHPDPITIEEQHPLKLNCSAVANPPPTYTWTLPVTDANRSSISGSVLTISSVTSADKGNYSCTVNNTMGNQTVTFSVDVQHKPYLQGTSHPDPITIEEQHPLKLNCSAVANPPPTYTWTLPVANRSSISGSVLTISSVTSADEGKYSCTVRNKMGNQTVTFNVDVQRLPSTTPPPNSGTGRKLIHRFTLCCMLLMSLLV
ncbi:hypothetical protein Q8A73_003059 [Channa argus]|nr:hypothetical protein Q8A73_003059 [Channa argus]